MIQIKRSPTDRILELGGGSRPIVVPECMGGRDVHVDVRMCQNEQGQNCVDFTADFNQPLPIKDNDFDSVIAIFVIEHLSFHSIPNFIAEMARVVKPGGKVLVVCPNSEAQMEWIKRNPNGWDGKDAFTACSEVLFGSQDYPENTHRIFITPAIAMQLFQKAGLVNIQIQPYGERDTDMCVTAQKPVSATSTLAPNTSVQENVSEVAKSVPNAEEASVERNLSIVESMSPEQLYDKLYWNGGGKVGGYAREGYWDYPVHNITVAHVLLRKPKSVLEVGCARGYILKRIQDAGIPGVGLEVSEHCYLTRACNGIIRQDLCKFPWLAGVDNYYPNPVLPLSANGKMDLAFSCAVLEHIPEQHVPNLIKEMAKFSERGLHGIDFGGHDDGFDRTHVTLKPKEWWEQMFTTHAPGYPVEIVDKEELERGTMPFDVTVNDGKVKLNVGCFTTMSLHNWINLDILDMNQFAQMHGYRFQQCDARQGLPFGTGTVDLIVSNHMVEHLTYKEAISFFRECRRVLKADGVMRIVVPDARELMGDYVDDKMDKYNEINDGAAECQTRMAKFWSLIAPGHQSAYDAETMQWVLAQAGFKAIPVSFRETRCGEKGQQILRETIDMLPCLSLYTEAVPA